jgi:hypothetical protein
VATGETLLVTFAVDGDVLLVTAFKLLDGGFDGLHAALGAHLLGGEVGVQTGTVPLAGNGLGVERDLGAELLGNAAVTFCQRIVCRSLRQTIRGAAPC